MILLLALAKSETSGLSQDLDNHALPPLAVPFPVEHALPRTEVEPAAGDRHDNLMAYRQAAQMGGGVVLPGLVGTVARRVPGGDRRLEPVENVVPESGLVIVDEDGGADMHGGDQHESLADPAGSHLTLDLIGDVDDFLAVLGLEPEIVGMRGHRVVSGWADNRPVRSEGGVRRANEPWADPFATGRDVA